MFDKVYPLVKDLMKPHESAGHGIDHIDQVYDLGMKIHKIEGGNQDIVVLATLLHDADDYKLFGEESSQNLTNAKRIMNQCDTSPEIQNSVCDIISTMGYSKLLAGVRPTTIEGKIVSDADMCCMGGATAVIRVIQFGEHVGRPIFDRNKWPRVKNLDSQEYKKYDDTGVNHFFEKLLKIKGLLFTGTARQLAEPGHEFMIQFLRQYFIENNIPEWNEYLDRYLQDI